MSSDKARLGQTLLMKSLFNILNLTAQSQNSHMHKTDFSFDELADLKVRVEEKTGTGSDF